jgi:uncharacterized membrane protein YccC
MAKKPNKSKGAAPAQAPDLVPRLAAHPRARRQIATAKAWGGFAALVLVAVLSHGAGMPWFDAIYRGLLAGIVGYLAAWMIAVAAWRNIARGELEVMRRRVEERRRALAEEAERVAEEERRAREQAAAA